MDTRAAARSARWLRRRPWLRLTLAMALPVLWLLAALAFLPPVR